MITLDEIKKYYPNTLHPFSSFLLREYLQYKILEIIFRSKYAEKLCFMGGTCIRIVHGNLRFSEDLDFDNFNLSEAEFLKLSTFIKEQLEKEGYQVTIKDVLKDAFHCHIRFPKLLYDFGLSGYEEQNILIQIDTESQHFDYIPEKYILNKFDVFSNISTTPVDILLAQKFYALLNRRRKKGRDFFDIVYLMQTTSPNLSYLKEKLGIENLGELKNRILKELETIDLEIMMKDVSPFIFNQSDLKKIAFFKAFIIQSL